MYRTIIAIGLASACSSLAAAQGTAWPQELDYARLSEAEILALDCNGVSAGVDRYAAECYDHQSTISKRQIDEAYSRAIGNAGRRVRPRLKRAQEAWERYAKATCSLWEMSEGTWPAMTGARCLAQVTRARADELRGLEALN